MDSRIKNSIKLWFPVIFWCGLIFYFSSVPNLRTARNPQWDEVIRSSLHLIFYAILFGLFFRAVNFTKKKKNFCLPLALSFFYGFSDEVHQIFVLTRTFQLQDLVIDFLGSVLGALIFWRLLPILPAGLKKWADKFDLT